LINLYNIQVSESEITEPVSLIEAKVWLNVDYDDDDALLTSMITGAREDIEGELNLKLVNSTASFYVTTTKESEELNVFPYALFGWVDDVEINLIEDGEADELQLIDEDYYLNGSLKVVSAQRSKVAYSITPVVPTAIKEAIKMLIAYRYNNRGDQEKQMGIPEDVLAKVNRYKQIWL
jgi:uncharacterized phiE125 gp8 family phage protein